MRAALDVRGITAGYGDIRALWDFSLSLQPGKVTVLFGRNGAGKTTALSALAGVVKVGAGSIKLGEREISGLPPYKRARLGLALVQENRHIFRRRTVEENLRLGGFWRYKSRRELDNAMEREYARFPVLLEKKKHPASTLSGGEQQMLAIAQALVASPLVLMLDEPSAGLAPVIVSQVFSTIARLKEEGIAILLVEQMVHQALQIADQVAALELGRLVIDKPASEVKGAGEIEDVYFGGMEAAGSR
ncbi:MAG: ABC transporter ATP-binding protein [Chloroflexia bacterium]